MKPRWNTSRKSAFTVLEVLVVILVLIILSLMVLPIGPGPRRPAFSVRCMSNLRQIGIGMHWFAEDNQQQFPRPAMATNAAAAEFLDLHSPATYLGALSPYLRNLQVWVCPTDKLKTPPGTNALQNRNLSYFLSLSVTSVVNNAILAGDRHLADEGKPIPSGIYVVTSNSSLGWTRELHPATRSVGGCLLFADAHAQFVSRTNLARIFREQSQALNRLAIP